MLFSNLPEGSFYMTAGGRPYPATSQLAFHLRAPFQVFGQNLVGWEALQYRFWSDPKQLAGKDAVVVYEGDAPPSFAKSTLLPYFQSVESAGALVVPAGTLGSWSSRTSQFTLFVGHGYRPK